MDSLGLPQTSDPVVFEPPRQFITISEVLLMFPCYSESISSSAFYIHCCFLSFLLTATSLTFMFNSLRVLPTGFGNKGDGDDGGGGGVS